MDRTPTHNTHLCSTVCSQAQNAHHALGPSQTDCSVIFVRLKSICHLVRICLPLTCRLPHHLPQSLFLLLRHKNTQHNRFIMSTTENTHAQLHALPVDKQRHQESLWRENLLSGGNPRTTTHPKSLRLSQGLSGKCGKQHHRAPITEEVKEFREIGTRPPVSETSETLIPIGDAFRRFRGKHCRF